MEVISQNIDYIQQNRIQIIFISSFQLNYKLQSEYE